MEGVCSLEIPKIYKPWFSSASCLKVSRSDPYSVSDLANSKDVATNSVHGELTKKRCKCKCCGPLETSIERVSSLEIPEICKPWFSSTSCLRVCRSDPYLVI